MRDLVGEARGQVQRQADQQQQQLVTTLHTLRHELTQMADRGGQSGIATEVVRQVSDRIEGLAGYLEARRPQDLLSDASDWARRRPGTFLLGAALAGVVAGRLTRASGAVVDLTEPATTGIGGTR